MTTLNLWSNVTAMNKYQSKRRVAETTLYDFEELRAKFADDEGNPCTLAEMAARCQLSERQISKMQTEGVNAYQLDRACVVGLGLLPSRVVGPDAWITSEALVAEDLWLTGSGDFEAAREEIRKWQTDLYGYFDVHLDPQEWAQAEAV